MFDIKIAGFSITSCLGTDYTSLKSGEIKYINIMIIAKNGL